MNYNTMCSWGNLVGIDQKDFDLKNMLPSTEGDNIRMVAFLNPMAGFAANKSMAFESRFYWVEIWLIYVIISKT